MRYSIGYSNATTTNASQDREDRFRAPGGWQRATRAAVGLMLATFAAGLAKEGSAAHFARHQCAAMVVVAADGSGDVTTIDAALGVVAPGGTIQVKAGVYPLGAELALAASVTLRGEGDGTILQ